MSVVEASGLFCNCCNTAKSVVDNPGIAANLCNSAFALSSSIKNSSMLVHSNSLKDSISKSSSLYPQLLKCSKIAASTSLSSLKSVVVVVVVLVTSDTSGNPTNALISAMVILSSTLVATNGDINPIASATGFVVAPSSSSIPIISLISSCVKLATIVALSICALTGSNGLISRMPGTPLTNRIELNKSSLLSCFGVT